MAEREEISLRSVLRAARDAGAGEVSADRHRAGRSRLLETLARSPRGPSRRPFTTAIALATALALTTLVGGSALWALHLDYRVEGGVRSDSGYVHAPSGGRPVDLRFSDGTDIVLSPGSWGRVTELGWRGAHVALESGTVSLDVVHRAGAKWAVEAGPFVVLVTGTAFDVSWSGADGELRVALRRGGVTVRGPMAGEGVELAPGQKLVATLARGELRIEPLEAHESSASPAASPSASPISAPSVTAAGSGRVTEGAAGPAAGASIAVERGGPPPTTSAAEPLVHNEAPPAASLPWGAGTTSATASVLKVETPPGHPAAGGATPSLSETGAVSDRVETPADPASEPSPAPRDWGRRVATGDFRGVLREADSAGLETVLSRAPLADLQALADAARYGRRPGVARRALVAERTRFAGTAEARTAAFLIGRIVDDDEASPRGALAWYEVYFAEGGGAFASEALGRKLLALRKLEGDAGARRTAVEYLQKYPTGAYGAVARQLAAAE